MEMIKVWNVLDPRLDPAIAYNLAIVKIDDEGLPYPRFAFVKIDPVTKDYVRYLAEPNCDGINAYSKMHIHHLESRGCVVFDEQHMQNMHNEP